MKTKIGTISLVKQTEFNQQYETAAWYKLIRCEPQTVDLFFDSNPAMTHCAFWATFEGVNVGENFTSLYGGVPFGKSKVDEHNGQRETYTVSFRDYGMVGIIQSQHEHDHRYTVSIDPELAFFYASHAALKTWRSERDPKPAEPDTYSHISVHCELMPDRKRYATVDCPRYGDSYRWVNVVDQQTGAILRERMMYSLAVELVNLLNATEGYAPKQDVETHPIAEVC